MELSYREPYGVIFWGKIKFILNQEISRTEEYVE